MRYITIPLALITSLLFGSAGSAEQPASCSDDTAAAFLILPAAPAASAVAPLNPPNPESVPKRLLGVIPNYKADQYQIEYKPLSVRQKFAIARSDSFDWPNYFLLLGFAAQSQMAAGGFSKTGGLKGFGEYYARADADQIIGSYVTEAILPALVHEDPRYFRLGTGPMWARSYHAVSEILITRRDDGRYRFNVSEVVGNAGVSALATLYYPNSRTASDAAVRYTMGLGNDAIANLLTEFWPDIRRRLPRKPGR